MKSKSKELTVFTCFLIAVCGCQNAFVSPSQQEELSSTKNEWEVLEQINRNNSFVSEVGKLHNEIVGEILSSEKPRLCELRESTTEDGIKAIAGQTYSLLKQKGYFPIDSNTHTGENVLNMDSVAFVLMCERISYLSNEEILRSISSTTTTEDVVHNQSLTQEETHLIGQVQTVCNDDDTDILSVLSRLEAVALRAKSKLEGESQTRVLGVVSIACNTMVYWHSYSEGEPLRSNFSWKELGKQDVSGGIGAAAGGGVAALLGCGPVGWKAWVAVVAGGAAVSSVQSAVYQLL